MAIISVRERDDDHDFAFGESETQLSLKPHTWRNVVRRATCILQSPFEQPAMNFARLLLCPLESKS